MECFCDSEQNGGRRGEQYHGRFCRGTWLQINFFVIETRMEKESSVLAYFGINTGVNKLINIGKFK